MREKKDYDAPNYERKSACSVFVKSFRLNPRVGNEIIISLSDKYLWERYEPPYPPSYGLNSTTTVLLGEWLWH